MSQRSAALCTRCTRTNAFPATNTSGTYSKIQFPLRKYLHTYLLSTYVLFLSIRNHENEVHAYLQLHYKISYLHISTYVCTLGKKRRKKLDLVLFLSIWNFIIKSSTYFTWVCMSFGQKRKKQVGPIAVSQHEKLCVKIKSKVQLHYKYVKSTTTLHKKPF